MVVCECSASGDPHFIIFDGQKLSYQGICPFLFAEAHSGPCYMRVTVTTAQSKNHPKAAFVEAINVTVGDNGDVISIGQNKEITVSVLLHTCVANQAPRL